MSITTLYDIRQHGLSRLSAMSVVCPKCGAAKLDRCTGRRNPVQERLSPHMERYDAAFQARGGK